MEYNKCNAESEGKTRRNKQEFLRVSLDSFPLQQHWGRERAELGGHRTGQPSKAEDGPRLYGGSHRLAAVCQGSPPCIKSLLGGLGGETSMRLTSLDVIFLLLYTSCISANSVAFPHHLFSRCSSPGWGMRK